MQDSSAVNKKQGGYGSAGDKQHLGGFGEIDAGGISLGLFKHMISNLGIKSVMDIGCGRGFSTSWFYFYRCDGKCKLFCSSCVRKVVLLLIRKTLLNTTCSHSKLHPILHKLSLYNIYIYIYYMYMYMYNIYLVICAKGSHDAWERSVLPDKENQIPS